MSYLTYKMNMTVRQLITNTEKTAVKTKVIYDLITEAQNETSIKKVQAKLKKIQKEIEKIEKLNTPRMKSNTTKPTGFLKKVVISNRLAHFLNLPRYSMLSRTQVIVKIWKYIRENYLQLNANRRYFNRDQKLNQLLQLNGVPGHLTLCDLQTLITPHLNGIILKQESCKIILTNYRLYKMRRFISQCALKSRLKQELEFYPNIGIKYFEAKQQFDDSKVFGI